MGKGKLTRAMLLAMFMGERTPFYKRNRRVSSTGTWYSRSQRHQNIRECARRLRNYPSGDLALYHH